MRGREIERAGNETGPQDRPGGPLPRLRTNANRAHAGFVTAYS